MGERKAYIGRLKFMDSHKYLSNTQSTGMDLARVMNYTLSESRSDEITTAEWLCVLV